MENHQIEECESPYCPVCDGCGEDDCCPATKCQMSPEGHYCETYLRDLKFGYLMHKDMWDLIPKDPETQVKLDEIFDKNYERVYRKETHNQ